MHPWWRWECFEAGFYCPASSRSSELEKRKFANFFIEEDFEEVIVRVFSEWPFSCEHFLNLDCFNSVAWIGQAAVFISRGVPSCYRGGFNYLDSKTKKEMNAIAKNMIRKWKNEGYSTKGGKALRVKLGEERVRERDSRRSSASFDPRGPSPFVQGDMFGYFEE